MPDTQRDILQAITTRLMFRPDANIDDLREKLLALAAAPKKSNMIDGPATVRALKLLAEGHTLGEVSNRFQILEKVIDSAVRHLMEVIRQKHYLPQNAFWRRNPNRYAEAWECLNRPPRRVRAHSKPGESRI